MFKTDLCQFPTPDNLLLPGLLFTPSKPTKKVAIFLHGCGSSSVFYSVKRAHALAKAFCSQGIALLMFNNRGAHLIKKLSKVDETGEEVEDILLGTSYELIKDSQHDIVGAINFLHNHNYQQLYLIGHSTGANKICVYNHYQPQNSIEKYILLGAGDDTGMLYNLIGNHQKFLKFLKQAQDRISQGKGRKFVPKYMRSWLISYQSFYDMANPDGDYNCFPYAQHLSKIKLSKKPLFRYFKAIGKPTLVIYGQSDQYAPDNSGQKAIKTLEAQVQDRPNFQFELIAKADHSFHKKEDELGRIMASWLLQ